MIAHKNVLLVNRYITYGFWKYLNLRKIFLWKKDFLFLFFKTVSMKSIFIIVLAIAAAMHAGAQSKKTIRDTTQSVFTIVEEMPEFPGGQKAMERFIDENLNRLCTSGKVYVTFLVDTTGALTSMKVLRGISSECDAEALRVVQSMPKWKPGKQNGRPVAVIYNLPVNFGKEEKRRK
jgi:TonB family protein